MYDQIILFRQFSCSESCTHCQVFKEDQAGDFISAYDHTLEGWAKILEMRDKITESHSRRVIDLTLQLARQFGIHNPELTHIRRGVLLHDIGKMAIPDQILKKTGPLDDEEWDEMRGHPQYAYDLICAIAYLRPALDIPYCHHERWDGTGYPRGLKGTQIPLAARLFTVVDVWDALSHDRPYREAWLPKKVLRYLRKQSGKEFDPQVVDIFINLLQNKHR
jgi:HD-GYP domain-containing protein (c-di-GMP phosphodiesterase class II)